MILYIYIRKRSQFALSSVTVPASKNSLSLVPAGRVRQNSVVWQWNKKLCFVLVGALKVVFQQGTHDLPNTFSAVLQTEISFILVYCPYTDNHHHRHWLDSSTWALAFLRSFCQPKYPAISSSNFVTRVSSRVGLSAPGPYIDIS
jgi:hypothetical protein